MGYEKKPIGYYLFEDIYKNRTDCGDVAGIWLQDVQYTYREIEKSVDYYARFLSNKGVKPGDHVALLGVNSYNWLIAFYAIVRVGAVAVLVNCMARHNTLVGLIKETDCRFLCYGKYRATIKKEGEFADLF